MGLVAFIKRFYVESARAEEEGLYKRRGFVSGTIEGWTDGDGSEQSIAIVKFATSQGAVSAYDGLTHTLRHLPSPHKVLTDPADGGVGTVSPTLDSMGNATAEIAAHTGDYMVDIHEFSASAPDPAAAKVLLLRQLDKLRVVKKA